MYIFIKTKDQENEFDLSDIVLKAENDINVADIINEFKSFLLACGFHPQSIKEGFREVDFEEIKNNE